VIAVSVAPSISVTRFEQKVRSAVSHSFALSVSVLLSYWIVTSLLVRIYFLSTADELLGGMWAVIATVFVYRFSYQQSFSAAVQRMGATSISFVLCLAYLSLFPFHVLGLAVLIGLGTLVMMMLGRPDDVITTNVTTAVVLVVAALSPHDAWEQPILRMIDTAIGVAIGMGGAWCALRAASGLRSSRSHLTDARG
jgi:uncharacterized membrane protein YccC